MITNKKYGLVIGRFQPPCLHHLQFINQVINSGIKKVFIGVGDSQSVDNRNFLVAKNIKSLLVPNLDLFNFPYEIEIIPDINNPPEYAKHVKKYFPEINELNTCLFTDNPYTSGCFIKYEYSFEVIVPDILPSRATEVRQLIKDQNQQWQNMVPKNVKEYIKNNKIRL